MRRIQGTWWWILVALLCLWVLQMNVSPAFTPVRAELVDARGFSRGLLNLVVLRRDRSFERAPAWIAVLCAAAFVLVWAAPLRAVGRTARVLSALGAIVFGATIVSEYVSPYRIVLMPRTFVLGALLLWAPRLAGVLRTVREQTRLARGVWSTRAQIVACGALGAAFFASAMLQTLAAYGGNYSGFLHLSRDVATHAPSLQERPALARSLMLYDQGYDGQFMYLMAFDPFMQRFSDRPQEYRAFIDNPPYRFGRIGFPLLTRLLAAGQPARYPAAMMWLMIAAHFGLALGLASIAARHGWSPPAALLYLGIPAFMSSFISALPEALACALLIAGFACWERQRIAWAALALAAALLVRETAIVLVGALVVATWRQDGRREASLLGASMVPAAAWRLFVAWRLFPDWGWRGLVASPGDLGVPFAGLVRLVGAGTYAFPLLLTAALALALYALWWRVGPVEAAAAVYAAVAVSLSYDKIWSHLPSGERGTFELFACLLLLLFGVSESGSGMRRGLLALFVGLFAYTFVAAPDAATSRAALLLIR